MLSNVDPKAVVRDAALEQAWTLLETITLPKHDLPIAMRPMKSYFYVANQNCGKTVTTLQKLEWSLNMLLKKC